MYQMKELLLLLVILSSAIVSVNCDSKSYTKSFQRNVTDDFYTSIGLSDESNSIFYAHCPLINFRGNYTCRVTVETPVTEPLGFTEKSCDFIFSSWNNDFIDRHLLRPLNDKTVLLINNHKQKNSDRENLILESTIYVIQMTDCSVSELSLPNILPGLNADIVKKPSEDYFDILYIIRNTETTSDIDCKNNICRIRYNLDGKLIDGPMKYQKIPSSKQGETWIPLWATLTPNLAYYRFYKKSFADGVYQVRDGIATEFYGPRNLSLTRLAGVSGSNNKVSFCLIYYKAGNPSNNGTCRQYDPEGNQVINFELIQDKYTFDFLVPYNLKKGGLIVVVPSSQSTQIFHVRDDGQYSLLSEDTYNRKVIFESTFFEDDTEICFKFITLEPGTNSQKRIYTMKCISKTLV